MLILKVGKESKLHIKLIHFKATCPICGCVALLDVDDVLSASDLKAYRLRTTVHYICPDCKKAVISDAFILGRFRFFRSSGFWKT